MHGNQATSKLSIKDVLKIRRLIGKKTQKEISDLFDVHDSTISRVMNNKTWTMVN